MNTARTPHTGQTGKFDSSQQLIVWVLVVLGAFALGLFLGATSQEEHSSRVEWPQPVHPRRILP
jgi:hypothetical protein